MYLLTNTTVACFISLKIQRLKPDEDPKLTTDKHRTTIQVTKTLRKWSKQNLPQRRVIQLYQDIGLVASHNRTEKCYKVRLRREQIRYQAGDRYYVTVELQ